jgi:hypothetical protein
MKGLDEGWKLTEPEGIVSEISVGFKVIDVTPHDIERNAVG